MQLTLYIFCYTINVNIILMFISSNAFHYLHEIPLKATIQYLRPHKNLNYSSIVLKRFVDQVIQYSAKSLVKTVAHLFLSVLLNPPFLFYFFALSGMFSSQTNSLITFLLKMPIIMMSLQFVCHHLRRKLLHIPRDRPIRILINDNEFSSSPGDIFFAIISTYQQYGKAKQE